MVLAGIVTCLEVLEAIAMWFEPIPSCWGAGRIWLDGDVGHINMFGGHNDGIVCHSNIMGGHMNGDGGHINNLGVHKEWVGGHTNMMGYPKV